MMTKDDDDDGDEDNQDDDEEKMMMTMAKKVMMTKTTMSFPPDTTRPQFSPAARSTVVSKISFGIMDLKNVMDLKNATTNTNENIKNCLLQPLP